MVSSLSSTTGGMRAWAGRQGCTVQSEGLGRQRDCLDPIVYGYTGGDWLDY